MIRILDILLSLLALLLLIPFLIPVAIVLKVTGEGEIFYIQTRIGREGKKFGLYKFATMLKDSPKIGAGEITLKDDPRVLTFGKFLRKTKINELPQLWNVVLGEMSLVGPRPMVPSTYAEYREDARELISQVRPGLTGVGSILFRDEERFLADLSDPMSFYKEHIIPYKSKLEIWYVENNSVEVYLKVILATAWVILFPSSRIVDKIFDDLPAIPIELRN